MWKHCGKGDRVTVTRQRKTIQKDASDVWKRNFVAMYRLKHAGTDYNDFPKTLRRWISDQRTYKRNGKLGKDKAKALEKIGFEWEMMVKKQMKRRVLQVTVDYRPGLLDSWVDSVTHKLAMLRVTCRHLSAR